MTRRLFRFDAPDRFLTGTVGDPGERSFYLQARQGAALVSLAVEKAQVAALASRMVELAAAVAPETAPDASTPSDGLELPIVAAFRVGAMALAWDATRDEMVIEAQPISENGGYLEIGDADPDGPALFRVRLDIGTARAFARQAVNLVGAGRPACPFCGQPIDAWGHLCPRADPSLN